MHIKTVALYAGIIFCYATECAQEVAIPFEQNIQQIKGTPIAEDRLPRYELTNIPETNPEIISLVSCFASASIALPIVRNTVQSSFYRRHKLLIESTALSLNAFSTSRLMHEAIRTLESHSDCTISHFTDIAHHYNTLVSATDHTYQVMILYNENNQRRIRIRSAHDPEQIWAYDESIERGEEILNSWPYWSLLGSENTHLMKDIITKAKELDTQLYPISNLKPHRKISHSKPVIQA